MGCTNAEFVSVSLKLGPSDMYLMTISASTLGLLAMAAMRLTDACLSKSVKLVVWCTM